MLLSRSNSQDWLNANISKYLTDKTLLKKYNGNFYYCQVPKKVHTHKNTSAFTYETLGNLFTKNLNFGAFFGTTNYSTM